MTEKVENIKANFDAAMEITTARVDVRKSRTSVIQEQVKNQTVKVNEFVNTHTDQLEQLKLELNRVQKFATMANQTTYIYCHVDKTLN